MTSEVLNYVAHLTEETGQLAAVSDKHLDLPVPHIEGWTVQTVVGHTGWVCRYLTQVLGSDPDSPPRRSDVPEPPPGPEVIEWFAEARADLLTAIDGVGLEQVVPSFTGPQPASWWVRRIAHESAMHRWDMQSAIGSPNPIDQRLARDGIDEVFEVFATTRLQFDVFDSPGKTIHLHATDIDDGEWMLRVEQDALEWSHGHEKGDVAARGPVADLLLMLWSRIPASRLDVFGEAELLTKWQAAAAF